MRAYDKIIIEDENAKPEVEKTAGNKRVEKKVYRAKDAALYKDEVVLSDAEITSVKEEALKPKRKYKKAESAPEPVIPAAEVVAEEPKAEKKEKILYKRIEVSDSIADDTASEKAKKSGAKSPLFFAAKKAVTEETTADEKTEETAPEEAKREEDQPELAEPSEEAAATKPSGKKSNAFSALLASIKKTDKKSEAEEKACEPEAAEPKEESKPCDKEAAALETSEQEAAETKEESETNEDAAEAKESEQQAREEAPSVASAEKAVAAPVEELEKRGKRVFRARDKKQAETVQGEPETKQEKKDEEKSKAAPSKASEKETENKPSEKKEKKSKTVYVAEESVKPDVKVKTKKAAKWLVASVIILALLFITAVSAYGFYQNSLPPEIESVSLATESDEPQLEGLSTNGEFSENDTVKISVAVKDNFFKTGESWFIAPNGKELPSANDDGWVLAVDGKAELELGVGNHYIFVKDERGNISGLGEDVPEFNRVIAIRINSVVDITYLPIMGTRVFTADIVSIGDADESVTWSIDDTSVALCDEGGQVIGVSNGVTEMVATAASGVSTTVDIMVTDLITIPDTNTYGKPMLGADQFTDEEAALLDKYSLA
ncbi:MAG: hypothetical protein GX683_06250, partial [Ruminococcaceae bacterium]|nr:hypothetical protein [Oscillospiraceae bacterium]